MPSEVSHSIHPSAQSLSTVHEAGPANIRRLVPLLVKVSDDQHTLLSLPDTPMYPDLHPLHVPATEEQSFLFNFPHSGALEQSTELKIDENKLIAPMTLSTGAPTNFSIVAVNLDVVEVSDSLLLG